jgi:type II secretory pathway component PulK
MVRSRLVRRHDRRGVALILVLSLLVVLGVVAADVGSRAQAEGRVLIALKSRAQARYAAESGILLARSSIAQLVDSAPEAADRATKFRRLDSLNRSLHHQSLGNTQFEVAILDLNARIDLNRASEHTLHNLFHEFISDDRAATIAAALKADPIARFGELARVPGSDDDLALAVAPYVTIWGDGIVNLNSAPEAVLAALPGIGPAVARTIVQRRDAGETFSSPDEFRHAGPATATLEGFPPMTVAPSRLMIVSRGWLPGSPAAHEIQAVYVIVGTRLTLQSWEERDR